jgi:hypothetical protein
MAKGKKKAGKQAKTQAKKQAGSQADAPRPRRPTKEPGEPCPLCEKKSPLFWHGRRVLCASCIEDNTHVAERGEITMANLVRGGVALFRDVGWVVVALILGYSIISKAILYAAALEDETQLAASYAREILGLIFVAAAFDIGLTRLDGETPSLRSSLSRGVQKFLPLFLAQSLQGLIVLVHGLFLLIPGVVKALSYAVVTPLVVSGEAGAVSCLHESWRRMNGHRKNIAPLMLVLWIPFVLAQYFGLVLFQDPGALERSPALMVVDAVYPVLDIPWLFVALSLHAKLRRDFRISAD